MFRETGKVEQVADSSTPTASQIQAAIMQVFAHHDRAARNLGAYDTLREQVRYKLGVTESPSATQIMEALWALVGQGLVYLNFYRPTTVEHLSFDLTETGKAAAKGELVTPDSPDAFLARLQEDVPSASAVVTQYVSESLRSYTHGTYLASAVMLGVAAETAFLEMAEPFARWLSSDGSPKLATLLANPRASYQQRFEVYRNHLATRHRDILPFDLAEDIDLKLNTTLRLLRIYRNDAGHPKGKQVARAHAKRNLELFAVVLGELYELKDCFERLAHDGTHDTA